MSNYHNAMATNFQFNTECHDNCFNVSFSGIYPQNKIERVFNCSENPTDQWIQFNIPEIVDIPSQKPDIEDIVSIHSCIQLISQRVVYTPTVTGYRRFDGVYIPGNNISNSEGTRLTGKKLIIEGLLKQKIVYTALMENQPLHSASFDVPFSVFIIVDGTVPVTQSFNISPYIEDIYTCVLSTRSVFKNTTIFIKASQVC